MTLNAVIFLETPCSASSSFQNLEMRVWFRENEFYNAKMMHSLQQKFPFTPDPTYSLIVKLTLKLRLIHGLSFLLLELIKS